MTVRIQKALADAGVASRRAADALVAAGRVSVNGEPAEIGQRVDPGSDSIAVDGRPLQRATERIYLALSKPEGVTSTVADRHAERTVLDLVPGELRTPGQRLFPVGRLDRDSAGLILLTNDGDWAQRILHPSHGVEREYAVGVEAPLTPAAVDELQRGVELDEGVARLLSLRPATAAEIRSLRTLVGGETRYAWYRCVLTQGWRRQVRRMLTAVGAPVQRLVRVRIGVLRLDGLELGSVRQLSPRERALLVAPPPAGSEVRR